MGAHPHRRPKNSLFSKLTGSSPEGRSRFSLPPGFVGLVRRLRSAPPQAKPVCEHAPAYVLRTVAGWRVCTSAGVLCHSFAAWYDECHLLPGGHVELRKRHRQRHEVVRFNWDAIARAYSRVEEAVE